MQELIKFKYRCDFCDKYFQSRTHLDMHIRNDLEAFICDMCNEVLVSSGALTQHKCAECDALFKW